MREREERRMGMLRSTGKTGKNEMSLTPLVDLPDEALVGENDQLEGGSGNDYMHGGAGNDVLFGGFDDDHMFGGVGNDVLYGSTGRMLQSTGKNAKKRNPSFPWQPAQATNDANERQAA